MKAKLQQSAPPPAPLGAVASRVSQVASATSAAWSAQEEAYFNHCMATGLTRPDAIRKFKADKNAGKLPQLATPTAVSTLDGTSNPTVTAEALAQVAKTNRLADLEEQAFAWFARGREANIELGRLFDQIKVIVGHGQWEPYYAAKFAPVTVSLRTAQSYMKLAEEADAALTKNASSALFPPATDEGATAVQDAVQTTKNTVAAAAPTATQPKPKRSRKARVRLDGFYNLPLWLSGNQKDDLDALRNSQNWTGAEREIVATIDRLFIKYGLVNPPVRGEINAKRGTLLSELETQVAMEKTRKKLTLLPEDVFIASCAEKEPEHETALA